MWKAQYTSLGGRLVLINFVLDTLSTHVMSTFPTPPKVMKKMDRLGRDFLWHGCKEGKWYKLVNWQTTMHSREQGGLGIKIWKHGTIVYWWNGSGDTIRRIMHYGGRWLDTTLVNSTHSVPMWALILMGLESGRPLEPYGPNWKGTCRR